MARFVVLTLGKLEDEKMDQTGLSLSQVLMRLHFFICCSSAYRDNFLYLIYYPSCVNIFGKLHRDWQDSMSVFYVLVSL